MRKRGVENHLEIGSVLKEEEGDLREGVLLCPDMGCLREYPVIDSIPVIVENLRDYISQNILSVYARSDLTGAMESLLGDCCGPGSPFDVRRQHLSTYGFDHYGDLDPEEAPDGPHSPGSVLKLIEAGLPAVEGSVPGPVIDVGCAMGRTTFDLASVTDELVLGVDLNYDFLRTASRVLREGVVSYPRRRVGVVYDTREFSANFPGAERVDFWACDGVALPFAAGAFSLAASLNVLDCVTSPRDHLLSLARILRPKGCALIATPYDWSPTATPLEAWLGGHSQRSEGQGASDAMLRSLLAGGGHPHAVEGLRLVSEIDAVPWSVRLHDRSVINYLVHLIVAEAE